MIKQIQFSMQLILTDGREINSHFSSLPRAKLSPSLFMSFEVGVIITSSEKIFSFLISSHLAPIKGSTSGHSNNDFDRSTMYE
jgi:hypothetical protein